MIIPPGGPRPNLEVGGVVPAARGPAQGANASAPVRGPSKFVPSWDVNENHTALHDAGTAVSIMRGFVLPGDRESLSHFSNPDLMDEVPLKLYQVSFPPFPLLFSALRVLCPF